MKSSEALLLELLFDPDKRRAFLESRAQFLEDEGVAARERAMWLRVDGYGLELDASMRGNYLMSALCRSYVVTACCLGAAPGGREALMSFLASKALFGELAERTAAFGRHLATMLELNTLSLPTVTQRVLLSVLSWERAVQTNAAAVRTEAEAGRVPPAVKAPSAGQRKRGKPALPPFFIAAELPLPQGVLLAALDHPSAEDAWLRLRTASFDFDRVLAATRATAMPVTMVARGQVRGVSQGPGESVVSALVDVSHVSAEIPGRRSAFFAALDGKRAMGDLEARDQLLARSLLDAGLLVAE